MMLFLIMTTAVLNAICFILCSITIWTPQVYKRKLSTLTVFCNWKKFHINDCEDMFQRNHVLFSSKYYCVESVHIIPKTSRNLHRLQISSRESEFLKFLEFQLSPPWRMCPLKLVLMTSKFFIMLLHFVTPSPSIFKMNGWIF